MSSDRALSSDDSPPSVNHRVGPIIKCYQVIILLLCEKSYLCEENNKFMFSLDKAREFAMSSLSAVNNMRNRAIFESLPKDVDMKGLYNFISRIRHCNSAEDEDKIVNQELAKIRSLFKKPAVDGYNKKKSICKLIYVFLLGKQVSFGQSEALSLLSSNVIAEKQIGYLFISILFNSKSDTNSLFVQCIMSDLKSNNAKFAYLAIQCVANVANKEMAAALGSTIFDLVRNKCFPDYVVQSALLCLLKLVRVSESSMCTEWSFEVLTMMSQSNLGVVFNAIPLLDELIKFDPELSSKKTDIVRIVVSELRRILSEIRPGLHEYQYGSVPAPWHLVSFMRILRHFGVPEDTYGRHMLEEVLNAILDKVQEPVDSSKVRKDLKCTNVRYAVFFEAVTVISRNTVSEKLWTRAQQFAGWLLGHKICNFRYLALEALGLLAASNFVSKPMESILKKAVVALKKESDPSIQQRAVDFLCKMCNHSNVTLIVEDLLEYLQNPECANRSSVVTQIAMIADQSIPNYTWYVGILVKLILIAGDDVEDKICSKIVHIVSARSDVQKFVADVVFKALMEPFPHEKLLIIAAFILGEFGGFIVETESQAILQFQVLRTKYAHSSAETKAVVLSSFLKMAHKRPVLKKMVCDLFRENGSSCDLEIQKRSVEYLKLLESSNHGFLSAVLRALPPSESELMFSEIKQDAKRRNHDHGDTGDSPTIFVQVPGVFGPFVSVNKGVLHDDAVLKITLDSSYQGSSGHMTVSFESKFLSVPTFSNPKLHNQDGKLEVKLQQKNQRKSKRIELNFAFECHQVFDHVPKVYMELSVDSSLRIKIILNVPVFVNKFFEPVPMTDEVFGERWHTLASQSEAVDRFFHTTKSHDIQGVRSLLVGSNLSLLTMRESNPSTYVFGCGGVFQTTQLTVGCLVKIEFDATIKSYFRVSVRSPDAALAKQVAELLQNIL